jgi:N-acetylglutamate synthase-like GNAT family acetyltransferase
MMCEFEKYQPTLLPEVLKIFRSNMPKYFFDYEEKLLVEQLTNRIFDYYLLKQGNTYIGAGGIGLNADDSVSLCWGMVHKDFHNKHYGEALLKYRLDRIKEKWAGKKIINVTSQHTTGFFEKYGFKIVGIKENGFGLGLHECKMELIIT